ncbi:MAG: phage tail tape measure protein [Anaerolineales bacterium]
MAIQLGSAYGQVVLDASGVHKGTRQAQNALGGLETSVQRVFQYTIGNLAAQGISRLISGMGELYQETKVLGTGFESQMAIMSMAVDPAVASLDDLHGMALLVGEDTRLVGIDATQAADAMTGLFKSGLSVNEAFGDMQGYMAGTVELGGALRASIDLQAASALDLAQASDSVAVSMKTFGLSADEATEIADNFVQTADASVAEVEDLVEALENIGPTAAAFGWELQETNNALALLSTRGIQGAEAGTALKSMLTNMLRNTDEVQGAWDALNVELYDAQGNMRAFPDILGDLENALAGMTQEQRDYYVLTVAGSYGQKALNTLLAEGRTGWDAMAEATRNASTAAEVAAARTDTLAGAQEALEGSLETLKIRVSEEFIPLWREATETMTAMVDEHGPAVVAFFGDVADGIAATVDWLGRLDPVVVSTATQMTGLVAGFSALRSAMTTLAPVASGLSTALSDAVVGIQLMKQGAGAAEVATLGWSAALGPIVVGLAALTLSIAAVNKSIEFHNELQQETAEATDEWTQYLTDQAREVGSATELVDAYTAKQAELSGALDETAESGDWLTRVAVGLVREQKALQADTGVLHDQLLDTARGYEDYRLAVERVNREVEEASWSYGKYGQRVQDANYVAEHSIEILGRQAFAAERSGGAAEDAGWSWQRAQEGMAAGAEAARLSAQASADAERMAEAQKTAWQSFAGSVEQGVQGALAAYKAGNEEMYQEQQRALAQMLWNQTDVMQGLGQITEDEALTMKSAIAEDFGVMVDDTQVATTRLLTMFDDWSTGGETAASDIVGFLTNIGTETDTLVDNEIAATEEMLTDWEHRKNEMATRGAEMENTIFHMAETTRNESVSAAGEVGKIEDALESVTSKAWTIEIEVDDSRIPDEFRFNSPNFRFYYALQDLVSWAGNHPIPIGAQVDTAGLAAQAEILQALRAAPTQLSPTGGPAGNTYYDQRKVEVSSYPQNEVDVEILARRVAELMRSRR